MTALSFRVRSEAYLVPEVIEGRHQAVINSTLGLVEDFDFVKFVHSGTFPESEIINKISQVLVTQNGDKLVSKY